MVEGYERVYSMIFDLEEKDDHETGNLSIRSSLSARRNNYEQLQIKGNWNEVKGKLKQQYAKLTDDDLTYVEGKEDELLGRIQKRLGVSAEEARRILEK